MSEVQGDVICNQSFFISDFTPDFTDLVSLLYFGNEVGTCSSLHIVFFLFCNVLFEKNLLLLSFVSLC